jgi:hypothetical protein
MRGLVPGVHALMASHGKDVDGRDKPGHDDVAMVDATDVTNR